jgi:FkbM family methyltransferase
MNRLQILHGLGRVVTRFLLSRPVRNTRLGRSAYTRLYLAGKSLADSGARLFLDRHIEPGMVILDIGANVGFYSLLFAQKVGPQGKVYAFEPDPLSRQILEDRRRAAGATNLQVAPIALGEHEGKVILYCNPTNRADNRIHDSLQAPGVEAIEVRMTPLDTFRSQNGIDRIDALKMDVQGAEVAVLRGMRQIMRETPPRWMFLEFEPELLRGAGSSPEELWALLDEYGYEAFSVGEDGQAAPVTDRDELARRYATRYVDLWLRRVEHAPAQG